MARSHVVVTHRLVSVGIDSYGAPLLQEKPTEQSQAETLGWNSYKMIRHVLQ